MCCSSSDACSCALRLIASFMCGCVCGCVCRAGWMLSSSRYQSPGGARGYYYSSAVTVEETASKSQEESYGREKAQQNGASGHTITPAAAAHKPQRVCFLLKNENREVKKVGEREGN